MWRTDSLEKSLRLGKIEGRRRRGRQRRRWLYIKPWDGYIYWMASPTQWTWIWASSGNWWWTGRAGVLQSWTWQRLNWTEPISRILPSLKSRMYWPSPLPLLQQFLRAIWGAVSWAAVLILPQMKLNSTSHIVHLLVFSRHNRYIPCEFFPLKKLFIHPFVCACAGSLLVHGLLSSRQGLLSSCGAWISYCGGFSSCRAWTLGWEGFHNCVTRD